MLSPTEQMLALRPVAPENESMLKSGIRLFTNENPLWRPPGARGVYGAAIAAQCLKCAHELLTSEYVIHSIHCYFVQAGVPGTPFIYMAEKIRTGKSFATCRVDATQNGTVIFTSTSSFTRGRPGRAPLTKVVEFQRDMPTDLPPIPPDDKTNGADWNNVPFQIHETLEADRDTPGYERRKKQWLRARGKISEEGGLRSQIEVFTTLTDCYYAVCMVSLMRLRSKRTPAPWTPDLSTPQDDYATMFTSLDHTVYFHQPHKVKADEWIYAEMQPSWAGNERSLIHSKIYSQSGILLASCVQETMLRLEQEVPKL